MEVEVMAIIEGVDERVIGLYDGNLVYCTEEEYRDFLRSQIQDFAGRMVDHGQDIRAMIALQEVKRLDRLYEITGEENGIQA